ncbi:MAG: glycoside hydrolase family 3 N-terminal domain-containing protein [Limnothrix sp.]
MTTGILPKIESLSLRQLIGQMIVVRTSGHLFDHERSYPQWETDQQTLQRWLRDDAIGGVILLGGSAAEISLKTAQLQSWAEIPLLIAADIEEGVGQRFSGATWFPPPMALGEIWRKDEKLAIALAEEMGAITAKEALGIGINWVLAPVMDVNNNPKNPVINVRAFGETPEQVAALGTAFIRGAQQYPALTTAKHFPGHGDTAADSHVDLPTIDQPIERLNQIEIPPFQAAIATDVDTVMTAHLMIPAWDDKQPATLSKNILTGQLRETLNFQGLIVTDALMMGGVTTFAEPAEVAVQAIEAGADILLMPPDVELAIAAIETAIKTGRLNEARLRESVTRIFQAKQKCQTTPTANFPKSIEPNKTKKTVQQILTASTRHSNERSFLPSFDQPTAQNLIVVDSLLKSDFLKLNSPAIAIPQRHGYQPLLLEHNQVKALQLQQQPTLVQFFVRGNPFAGAIIDPAETLKFIAERTQIVGICFYGSPYYFKDTVKNYVTVSCYSTYGQMAIAQYKLCQTLWSPQSPQSLESSEFT